MSFEDTISSTVKGSSPKYNLAKDFRIVYNEDIRAALRHQKIEFIVFDDNVPFD